MTESFCPLASVLCHLTYRSGKGCADGDALRKTADTRCLRLSLLDAQRIQTNERRTSVLPRPSSVLRFPERR